MIPISLLAPSTGKPVWSRLRFARWKVSPALVFTLALGNLTLGVPLFAQESAGTSQTGISAEPAKARECVDYVNPYLGNISHLLVPTFPTVSLPNSVLRMIPDRDSFTSATVGGLNLVLTSHRSATAFRLRPFDAADGTAKPPARYTYDQEKTTPYRYSVYLDEQATNVTFAPAHKAAVYTFTYEHPGVAHHFALNAGQGALKVDGRTVHGYQPLGRSGTRVYLYLEFSAAPESSVESAEGAGAGVVLSFGAASGISARYGISYLSEEQAKRNLEEIDGFDLEKVARAGRQAWNEALGKIRVEGGSDDARVVFYTSLYRVYERMINVSEDGKYYSPFDHQIHEDGGVPFYTDDWIWDTFRAAHPLRVLINPEAESNMVASYVRMAQQSREGWMPTFPAVTGDGHAMNGKHFVSIVWDAYRKGLRGFDLEAAYAACKKTLLEATLCPWRREPAGSLDAFYKEQGYYPALKPGETETVPTVDPAQKREPVAVTLAASYDAWCLAQIAKELGKTEDQHYFERCAYNYRHLFNPATGFFHPKDSDGNFIEPFDYRLSGGFAALDYYDENNGWTYRWDVQHNLGDLVQLMGGPEKFVGNLDALFNEKLGLRRPEYYARLPDSTGNIGQFTMANEPSMHIPYLYNYAGAPWKTQKRVRDILQMWFRNDLMGEPGDEDGGGMSAFVVFSSMGFYPVTPGTNSYNIGSPVFSRVTVDLGGGKTFVVRADGCSEDNKYVQSARLNGQDWHKPWFSQSDLSNGGLLELRLGNRPNKQWGSAPEDAPPSAGPPPASFAEQPKP